LSTSLRGAALGGCARARWQRAPGSNLPTSITAAARHAAYSSLAGAD